MNCTYSRKMKSESVSELWTAGSYDEAPARHMTYFMNSVPSSPFCNLMFRLRVSSSVPPCSGSLCREAAPLHPLLLCGTRLMTSPVLKL